MTHPSDLLSAFAAGTLPAERADPVARHVADCPGCAAELIAWRRVAGAVGDRVAAVGVPSPGLLDAVLARLVPARGAAPGVPRYAAPLGGAAGRRAVRILAAQRRLVDRRVWPVAAVVLAAGTAVAGWAPPGSSEQVLAIVVPLVAALGVAGACGSGTDPAGELVAASRTGVRAVLLARLTLVLGAIFGAASVASLGLAWFDAGAPPGLFAAWLGPMALLSAVSFALSVLWRPAVGIGVAMCLWVLRLLAGSDALDGTVDRLVEPLWRTSGPLLLVAALLMAGTLALLPHLPASLGRRAYGR
ncbi:zf-HC2 domain-containing protein [Plantactinospora sp. WMMB782]|uniref:zf-HC2 domain-containing protein n=1 Tax=Plantactinospora sp. WMMB782 TaxID=3404121 RepID=UPI003B9475D4